MFLPSTHQVNIIAMDEAQFKAYHDALQEKEQWQKKLQIENRSRADRRYTVEQQIRITRTCDGTSISAVREWLQDISLVIPYFSTQHADEDTLKVVAASLQGPMRRCYERFMELQPNRVNVTWKAVKTMIEASYLTADECEYLRSELEKICQTAYETTGCYSRKFVEAAGQAYPIGDRNTVVQRLVLERYVKGLRKASLVRRLVQEKDPQTLDEAILAVEGFTVQEERLRRMMDTKTQETNSSGEEKMEVGEVAMASSTSKTQENAPASTSLGTLNTSVTTLSRQLQGLQKEMTKLKGQTLYVAPPTTPLLHPQPAHIEAIGDQQARSYQHAWTPDGQPICFECKQIGHLGRDCEIRRKRLMTSTKHRTHPGNSGN